ncbi:MAG: AlpA family transcriptional regulator [Proteobacteria bacterium]|nr:AlpA family transcriptional regulator [Pseudomonadota bacterium]
MKSLVQTIPPQILRRPDVQARTGLKRSHIYYLMNKKLFPESIPLGEHAVGWDAQEIDDWVEARRRLRLNRPKRGKK